MSVAIDLSGRVALVTGAGGSIGAGIARRFHAAGATVAIHHRSAGEAATTLHDQLRGSVIVRADLTDADGPSRMVREVIDETGAIDILVNNAGIQPVIPFEELGDEDWAAMIDTNLTAAHRLTQAASAVMPDGGCIIHIASIEGSQPAPGHTHYAVAKSGLIMHARAAALELGRKGVRVNSVSPGLIDRPRLNEDWPEGVDRWLAAAPMGRLGTPEDVGDACVFLASDLARWISGVDLVVDGGILARPTW